MIEIFCPDLYVETLDSINLDSLYENDIDSLILDLDNTLVDWDKKKPTEKVKKWLQNTRDKGFKICILSNSLNSRVSEIADLLEVPAVSKALKPRKKSFREAVLKMNSSISQAAVIGDQILTDVLGGNRLGFYTILVSPSSSNDFLTTRFSRFLEGIILRRLKKKNLIDSPHNIKTAGFCWLF